MPPRVAIDYRPALLSRAGIARAVRELAMALARREDVELHLFAHSLSPARVAATIPERAHLHRLPIPGRTLPWLARRGWPAEQLAGKATVFHWTDYIHPPVGNAKVVLTVHDLAFVRDPRWHGPDAAVLRQRTGTALARATAVLVPSQTTAADLRAAFPDAPTARVIPFGADHELPAAAKRPPFGGRPYALCLGTIEPRKNHLTLLAAWRRLPPPRPLLVVVGAEGWECGPITAALRQAAHEGIVHWRRSADDAVVATLLTHARLLAYPSLWEGFGFPPLEAMRRGIPVVTHDCPPLEELCADAALRTDALDADALATALARALGDDQLRERLIAAGRQRADSFRWTDTAARHAAVYREVVA